MTEQSELIISFILTEILVVAIRGSLYFVTSAALFWVSYFRLEPGICHEFGPSLITLLLITLIGYVLYPKKIRECLKVRLPDLIFQNYGVRQSTCIYILPPLLCWHKADFRRIEGVSGRGLVDKALDSESGNSGSTPAADINFETFSDLFLKLKFFWSFNFF